MTSQQSRCPAHLQQAWWRSGAAILCLIKQPFETPSRTETGSSAELLSLRLLPFACLMLKLDRRNLVDDAAHIGFSLVLGKITGQG